MLSTRLVGIVALVAMAATLVGCAASRSGGDRLLADGRYDEAIAAYQAQLARNPENARAWRNLGTAYFRADRLEEALESFENSERIQANHPTTILYRGLISESRGRYDEAEALYRGFLQLGGSGRVADEIRQRLRWIGDRRLKDVVTKAIANEANVDVASIPRNSLAVVRFDATNLPAQYRPLGRGVAELIYYDLSMVPGLQLVERIELSQLEQELKLSQSEFADRMNSPRIGKIVGAARIVTGHLSNGEDKVSIDAGIIDVGPGLAEYPRRQEGNVGELFRMQKQLSYEIITKLGYEVTPEIRAAIDRTETESILALIAYSRGLEYADRGMYSLAVAEFRAAVSEDPNFGLAKQAVENYQSLSGYDGNVRPVKDVAGLVEMEISAEARSQSDQIAVIQRLQESTRGAAPTDENPVLVPRASRGTVVVTGRTD